MNRLTALQTVEYKAFGGNHFDSVAHSALFRSDQPHHFGVMSSRLFSSVDNLGLTNKRWTYLTQAQGNYVMLDAGKNEYTFSVQGDAEVEVRIVGGTHASGDQLGKNGNIFTVQVDRDWFREPVLFKCESDNAPLLEVVGEPEPNAVNGFDLQLKVQDGNTNSFVDGKWFTIGKTLVRVATKVSNEQNTKYGQDSYANQVKLRGQVGQVANKVEFTDRFLKLELSAVKKGGRMSKTYEDSDGSKYSDAFSRGHIYYVNPNQAGKTQKAKKGLFIPIAEQRLLERTEADANFMMEFGRWQTDTDPDSMRVRRVAPGWRQLVRDGQYFPHSGNFTLQWLIDKLHQVYFRRRNFKNRKALLVSGTGGINFLSQLIVLNTALPDTMEPNIRKNKTPTGVHEHEYEAGFQFTRFKAPMGIDIQIMYDPSKDDTNVYKQKAPGSYLPLESFQIDILDFGETEDGLENQKSANVTMVCEDMSDYYFSVSNAIDYKGIVKGGQNVWNFGKELSIYREKSCGLAIWDIGACGRIEWRLN